MSKSPDTKEYTEMREKGTMALATVLKQEQNIRIIEKYIHKKAKKFTKKVDPPQVYNIQYTKFLFQTVGDIIKGIDIKKIVRNINKSMIGWDHPDYDDIKHRIEESDEFIINPFEVEEGVTECGCGSKRVFTYSKQVRSCDEPMSTFAKCVKCKKQWTYSG